MVEMHDGKRALRIAVDLARSGRLEGPITCRIGTGLKVIPMGSQELSAVAVKLIAALDAYEQSVDVLVEDWDNFLYSESSELFDEVRMYAGTLPKVQVVYIELLLCRVELMEALWRDRQHPREIAQRSTKHDHALTELRQACARHYKLAGVPAGQR